MESELLETKPTTDAPPSTRAIAGIRVPGKFLPVGGLLLALLAFPLLHLVRGGDLNFYLNLLLIMFMHSTLASSWNIMGGYTGYISLGHNVFFAVGAYTAGILLAYHDIPVFVSAPLAGLLALLAGVVIGLITLRVRGPSFIIATVAMVLVLRIVLDNWDYVGGANGKSLPLLDLSVEWAKIPIYYAMLLTVALAVYMSYRIRHSKLGLGLRAISQDEIKAESAGIPTSAYKIIAFGLSGLFIGVAGAFWAQYLTYIRPSIFLLILIGAQMVLMCILGGKGTVAGPVVGAVLIISINELVLDNFGGNELNIFATGLLMLLVLVFFPDGIVGSLRKMGRLPGFLDWD
jgi:branched-chain amino acid transport system permease protein